MSEKFSVTKEQLVSLLKAAHAAHQAEKQPFDPASTAWIDWFVNYIVKQLQQSTGNVSKPPANKASTARLPDLPESQPKTESVSANAPATQTSQPTAAMDKPVASNSNVLQVCPTCAHRNRTGVLFCDNCGTNLLTGSQTPSGTRDLREAPHINAAINNASTTETAQSQAPAATPSVQLDEAEAQAVRTAGSNAFTLDMMLRIEVDGGAAPIIVKPKAEDMILGRRDPTTGATPEVDLTSYAGYRMGVSRRHASIALENNRLTLWDLGSSNGTFINGTRLTPHQPSPLRDGDEIRLGQMVLRLFFQKGALGKDPITPV